MSAARLIALVDPYPAIQGVFPAPQLLPFIQAGSGRCGTSPSPLPSRLPQKGSRYGKPREPIVKLGVPAPHPRQRPRDYDDLLGSAPAGLSKRLAQEGRDGWRERRRRSWHGPHVQPDVRVRSVLTGGMAHPLAGNCHHLSIGFTLGDNRSRTEARGADNPNGAKPEKEMHTHFGLRLAFYCQRDFPATECRSRRPDAFSKVWWSGNVSGLPKSVAHAEMRRSAPARTAIVAW